MAVLLVSNYQNVEEWREVMAPLLPGVEWRAWPDVGEAGDIDMAVTWKAPKGVYDGLSNLKLICSLGQGVDHLFLHGDLPDGVPITRLTDESMRRQMTAYVIAAVLRRLCRMADYEAAQTTQHWQILDDYDPAETTVGVLGVGALGRDTAEKLAALGFRVRGWSRAPKDIPGVECFAGAEALPAMLGGCDMVSCLLPLTSATRGLFNAATFAAMKPGAYLINTARGDHVVAADLMAALDSGQLGGATLDVFAEEPLPADNPLWRHPKITITPHSSAVSYVRKLVTELSGGVFGYLDSVLERHSFDEFGELI